MKVILDTDPFDEMKTQKKSLNDKETNGIVYSVLFSWVLSEQDPSQDSNGGMQVQASGKFFDDQAVILAVYCYL